MNSYTALNAIITQLGTSSAIAGVVGWIAWAWATREKTRAAIAVAHERARADVALELVRRGDHRTVDQVMSGPPRSRRPES